VKFQSKSEHYIFGTLLSRKAVEAVADATDNIGDDSNYDHRLYLSKCVLLSSRGFKIVMTIITIITSLWKCVYEIFLSWVVLLDDAWLCVQEKSKHVYLQKRSRSMSFPKAWQTWAVFPSYLIRYICLLSMCEVYSTLRPLTSHSMSQIESCECLIHWCFYHIYIYVLQKESWLC